MTNNLTFLLRFQEPCQPGDDAFLGTATETRAREERDQDHHGWAFSLGTRTETKAREENDQDRSNLSMGTKTATATREEDDADVGLSGYYVLPLVD
jgi:hypothetical protein